MSLTPSVVGDGVNYQNAHGGKVVKYIGLGLIFTFKTTNDSPQYMYYHQQL